MFWRVLEEGCFVQRAVGGRHRLQPGHFRGVPVRAASTTWVIAWLETAASAWLSSSDWWLAPATTRWTLLSDSAARSICGVSQLVWVSTGAVSTYSGRLAQVGHRPGLGHHRRDHRELVALAAGLPGGRQVGARLVPGLGGQLGMARNR